MRYLLGSTLICATLTIMALMKADGAKAYDSGVSDDDIKIILREHNKIRRQIECGNFPGLPKGKNFKQLKYDKNLAAEAQKIANTHRFKHVRVHDHRWPPPRGVGQNIYMYGSTSNVGGPNWKRAIDTWRNESRKYCYSPCGGSSATGHFTQIIWADTEFIGCGYASYKDGGMNRMLMVCNYGPGICACSFLCHSKII
ncbi:unnamed protein product [Callosobruchus maculatus]|uniref:SCP domain-containing protein n=2 Tax=Callosobruchus maculatus TaxID=64391 RepID=A0A653DJG8_CALMS|nr:unnamed protein product [Callosobruchus maculatus]